MRIDIGSKNQSEAAESTFLFLPLVSESSVSEPLQGYRDFCTGSDSIGGGLASDIPDRGQGSGGDVKCLNNKFVTHHTYKQHLG